MALSSVLDVGKSQADSNELAISQIRGSFSDSDVYDPLGIHKTDLGGLGRVACVILPFK